MLTAEAILAEELLPSITVANNALSVYKKTFEDNGVESKAWGYVWVTPQGDGLKKLEIIKAVSLRNRPSDSLYSLIKNCYIGGMQKLAESKAWLALLAATGGTSNVAEKTAMDELSVTDSNFPFQFLSNRTLSK